MDFWCNPNKHTISEFLTKTDWNRDEYSTPEGRFYYNHFKKNKHK
ncbi:hypothetical protein KX01_1301 [Francisella frigiditurris]|uniref:Uncharacterized protein n=1 Tax=Francisella frigiditurris TaxID=1542390 RepID=A0A1J0KUW4_9GAMM|nr:hypothetical protein KX01_1301 [Francisella frigiditurris]